MFSHVTLGVRDLGAAGVFYDSVLASLGLVRRRVDPDGGPRALCWIHPDVMLPRFYVYEPFNGSPATAGNGTMVAFEAPTKAAVDRAYNEAVANGGSDEGPPGPRPRYGDGYYGAYFRDPDGNKLHVVYRGDLR